MKENHKVRNGTHNQRSKLTLNGQKDLSQEVTYSKT